MLVNEQSEVQIDHHQPIEEVHIEVQKRQSGERQRQKAEFRERRQQARRHSVAERLSTGSIVQFDRASDLPLAAPKEGSETERPCDICSESTCEDEENNVDGQALLAEPGISASTSICTATTSPGGSMDGYFRLQRTLGTDVNVPTPRSESGESSCSSLGVLASALWRASNVREFNQRAMESWDEAAAEDASAEEVLGKWQELELGLSLHCIALGEGCGVEEAAPDTSAAEVGGSEQCESASIAKSWWTWWQRQSDAEAETSSERASQQLESPGVSECHPDDEAGSKT